MNGHTAASKALGHSSCGRWPHPDIATSLCTIAPIKLKGKAKYMTFEHPQLLKEISPDTKQVRQAKGRRVLSSYMVLLSSFGRRDSMNNFFET